MQKGVIPRITECPLVHRGHTMMLNCGRNLLSLDASFSAMRVANSHFWNSLAKLGRLISGAPGGSSIQTLLEGSAVYNMQIRTPLLRMKKNSKEIDRAYGQVHEFATKQYRSLMKDANKIPQMTVDMIKETGTKTMLFAQKRLVQMDTRWGLSTSRRHLVASFDDCLVRQSESLLSVLQLSIRLNLHGAL